MTELSWLRWSIVAVSLGAAVLRSSPLSAESEVGGWTGPAFSAIHVVNMGDEEVERSKVVLSAAGMRNESGPILTLIDYRQGKIWLVNTAKRLYAEAPHERDLGGVQAIGGEDVDISSVFDRQPCEGYDLKHKLGDDKVDGRYTLKWACGDSRTQSEALHWFDPKLGIVIREEAYGHVAELIDIHIAPQPATLFALPAGFKQLTPTELMRQSMSDMP